MGWRMGMGKSAGKNMREGRWGRENMWRAGVVREGAIGEERARKGERRGAGSEGRERGCMGTHSA